MKIAFLDVSHLAYDAATPFQRPLGGTQSAACYLAGALARRGHDITLFNNNRAPIETLNVKVRPKFSRSEAAQYNQFDAVVVLTMAGAKKLRQNGVTTALVHWQHQWSNAVLPADFAVEGEREAWDRIVFVSDHQRRQFVQVFGVDGLVLRNAPAPPFTTRRARRDYFFDHGRAPRFVYSSAPGRGLDFLLIAFPTIRAALPGAALQIYSDQKIYQIDPKADEYSVYYELARSIPGVECFGSVSQSDLAEAFHKADGWLYPTPFIETSCIAMMEAAASGCGLICSSEGALPETAEGFATLLDRPAGSALWSKRFAESVVSWAQGARAEPERARDRLARQAEHFCDMTWDRRAADWERMLSDLASEPNTRPGGART
jgi:glycosyltransferase involved in cell wall biosynthesis